MKRKLAVGAVLSASALLAGAIQVSAGLAYAAPNPTALGRADQLALAAAQAPAAAKALGLGAQEKLVVKDAVVDADGTRHFRYERTYGGLPVLGGDLVVHQAANGKVKSSDKAASGSLAPASLSPKLSAGQAASKATGAVQATVGISKDADEAALTSVSGASGDAQLVIWAADGAPRLAYRTTVEGVRADGTPSRQLLVTDADSGAVLSSHEEIQTSNATGSGNGVFVGSVSLTTNYTGSAYQLKDATRGGQYTTTGSNYVNAFWDDSCFCMTYGDGASNTHPLTELDVSGHEMSHGVTSNTAGLNYSGESGGLNEATSDIFGTLVEFYANLPKDNPDYLIGELININGNGTPLRYMDKPSKDGASADYWSSTVGNKDVHYSSGVANHFFYLLAEGSGAKTVNGVSYNSPTYNGAAVTGVGRAKAAQIWYRALTVYMTSSTNYKGARTATLNAAKDLYGSGSAEYNAVAAAWTGVNVN
ncbi:M4 family metallopeptidase [Kitasatospora phosalacinea]|uniref:M4 family metallopeptidase n=1 Tax=Kitasatospora phosalacinea TaxID=2065 RepID=UPI000525173E|nr:M4 family metallopeptidase [Kitasatospora phosalacinea]